MANGILSVALRFDADRGVQEDVRIVHAAVQGRNVNGSPLGADSPWGVKLAVTISARGVGTLAAPAVDHLAPNARLSWWPQEPLRATIPAGATTLVLPRTASEIECTLEDGTVVAHDYNAATRTVTIAAQAGPVDVAYRDWYLMFFKDFRRNRNRDEATVSYDLEIEEV